MKFARGSFEDEENSPLAAVSGRSNPQSLDPFFAQSVEVHLVLNISHKVHRLGATRIELVLKVRSFLDDRRDFILVNMSRRIFAATPQPAHTLLNSFLRSYSLSSGTDCSR